MKTALAATAAALMLFAGACADSHSTQSAAAADGAPRLLEWARDPAGQGITFQVEDLTGVFAGVVPAPIDWGRPEGL